MVYEDSAGARGNRSDNTNQPLVRYVYMLEFVDGRHYVGHTDDLKARLSEHSMGSDMAPRLVWFSHTLDREAARTMEARLKRAVERSPDNVASIIDEFRDLIGLIVPEKMPEQLQKESRDGETESGRSAHLDPCNAQSTDRDVQMGWGARWGALWKPGKGKRHAERSDP